MLLALLFSLVLQSAHAEECAYIERPSNESIDNLLNLIDPIALAHWPVSPTEFSAAPCKSQEPPSIEEIDAYLLANRGNENKKISGVRFVGESRASLDALKDLLDGEDFEVALKVPPACDKVVCAAERIWGEELGKKILYMRLRHGFNGSEYAHSNSARFNVAEIDQVLLSLRDLPEHLSNMGRRGNQKLIVAAPGVQHPNPNAYADAGIFLYNQWRADVGTSPYLTQYSLFHEYAHNISNVFGNADDSSEWKELNARQECRVSSYGNTNRVEDFAESLSMYRFGGAKLLELCPDKYNYIRDTFFNSVEYLTEATCEGQ